MMNIDQVDRRDLQSVRSNLHDDLRCSVAGGKDLEMVQVAVFPVEKMGLEKHRAIDSQDGHGDCANIVRFAAQE